MACLSLWYCRQETAERLQSCIVRLDCERMPAIVPAQKAEVRRIIDGLRQARIEVERVARAAYPFDPDAPIDEVRLLRVLGSDRASCHLENLILKDGDPGPSGGPLR